MYKTQQTLQGLHKLDGVKDSSRVSHPMELRSYLQLQIAESKGAPLGRLLLRCGQ